MRVLTDTGPLVAILSATDQYHEVCLQTVQNLRGPLLTCWPVITEAAWLLQSTPVAFERLLRSISDGAVEILPVAGKEAASIAEIMKKYGSLRPQFADAVLVYLAARENIRTIFTLDRRDFSVYRAGRKGRLRIVPE
ncbi:MAG TPA: PIN domain-containing protein [Candidatus Limnocylindrales bacterium]|nr:PIN domain-containing protein [Candidatus Limnocylindrales bacterium]